MMTLRTGSKKRNESNFHQTRDMRQETGDQQNSLRSQVSGLRSSSGLTLIEVLISVILLAGGAVLVMQSFATGWEAMARADDRSAAVLFAMSKLADLELASQQGHEVTQRPSGTFRVGVRPFAWSVDVQPIERGEEEQRLLTLSVTWPRGRSTDEAQFTMLLPAQPQQKEGT